MKIQQIRDFSVVSEIEVSDDRVISGELPAFLQRTAAFAMRQHRLIAFMTNYCNGLGNATVLQEGRGLIIAPDITLDAEDAEPDLSKLLTDSALKQTQSAIASWIKTIKQQIDAWKAEGVPLAEVRDRIPQLYSTLDPGKFALKLTQSMQLAYLGGRAQVIDETDSED